MELYELFKRCEQGKDADGMIGNFKIFIRPVDDPQVPHKYIMWADDINTGEEDYIFFDSSLELNRTFQIVTKSI